MDGSDGAALDDDDSSSETDEDGAGSRAGSSGDADERDEHGSLDWDKVLNKLGISRIRTKADAPDTNAPCGPLAQLCGSSASRYASLGRSRPAMRSRFPLVVLFIRFALPLLCLTGYFSAVYVTVSAGLCRVYHTSVLAPCCLPTVKSCNRRRKSRPQRGCCGRDPCRRDRGNVPDCKTRGRAGMLRRGLR